MTNTRTANYVVMSTTDIAEGRIAPSVQPGWAMGPFFPSDDVRHTDPFEIKNWDHRGVRSEWKDHRNAGSEYILVTHGTLTVVLGEPQGPKGAVTETTRIPVAAGYVIVLREGQWRRYECTPDVVGVSVRSPSR